MKAFLKCLAVLGTIGLLGCNPNSIGRPCINPAGTTVIGTAVESPALECPSRLCLLTAGIATSAGDGGAAGVCTAECESNDDCDAETKKYCPSGFVCAVATSTSSFACKRVCICRSDLQPTFNSPPELDGGVIKPCACKPTAKENCACYPTGTSCK